MIAPLAIILAIRMIVLMVYSRLVLLTVRTYSQASCVHVFRTPSLRSCATYCVLDCIPGKARHLI